MTEIMRNVRRDNWVAAAQTNTAPAGYTPLQLGSTVVGWTPILSQTKKRDLIRLTKVVMGDKVFDFEINTLWAAAAQFGLKNNDLYWKASGYFPIILNLPSESLDLTAHGFLIDYNERSTNTLHAALVNYFLLLEAHIQSDINSKTPAEVLEALLVLDNNQYPFPLVHRLSWRGTLLNDLLEPSRMMFFRQLDYDNPETEALKALPEELESFSEFAFLQVHWSLPQNIFFLKASSDEELSLGKTLFNLDCLNAFLEDTGHDINPNHDRVFFFGPADSCLADWIVGKTITVKELHEYDVSLI